MKVLLSIVILFNFIEIKVFKYKPDKSTSVFKKRVLTQSFTNFGVKSDILYILYFFTFDTDTYNTDLVRVG
jgi:hypothetical protein